MTAAAYAGQEYDEEFAQEVREALHEELKRHGINPEALRATTEEPYGPASMAHYADPGYQSDSKKRYPLDSESHCRAAWSYINMPDNARKYTPEQLARIKARIKTAGKKYGIEFADAQRSQALGVLDRPAAQTPLTYRRIYPLEDIHILTRAKGGGDGRTVEAYAAVFDVKTEIRDQHGHYIEENDPTAFNRTISQGAALRAQVLYNHGFDARGKSGGLPTVPIGHPVSITADKRGLLTVSRYNASEFADTVLESIKNGDITAQSYEGPIFRSNPMRVPKVAPGRPLPLVRRIEMGIRNYGPTPTPYYPEAEITAVRTAAELAQDFAHLGADEREQLIRALSTTPSWDPETAAILATPQRGPGTEDPRYAHSARSRQLRLRTELALMERAHGTQTQRSNG